MDEHLPELLDESDDEEERVYPEDYFKERIGKPVLPEPPELSEVYVWDKLPRSEDNKYYIYHPRHVIYGHKGVGLNGIDLDTSPGYPWTTMKGCATRKGIFSNRWENVCEPVKNEIELILQLRSRTILTCRFTLSH
jgi:hypothetical protein